MTEVVSEPPEGGAEQHTVAQKNAITEQHTQAINLLIFRNQTNTFGVSATQNDSLRPRKCLSRNSGLRARGRTHGQERRSKSCGRDKIRAYQLSQTHRTFDVDLASSLLKYIESGKLLTRVHQDHLDHIRRQLRINLEHQGCYT